MILIVVIATPMGLMMNRSSNSTVRGPNSALGMIEAQGDSAVRGPNSTLGMIEAQGDSPVRGPNSGVGTIEALGESGFLKYCSYSFLDWSYTDWDDNGNELIHISPYKVLIIDNAIYGTDSKGHYGSDEDYAFAVGHAYRDEGILAYTWTAVTWEDERGVQFSIDETGYDILNDGGLFLIQTNDNGNPVVTQVNADLSNTYIDFDNDADSIQEFAESNEDIWNFLKKYGIEL